MYNQVFNQNRLKADSRKIVLCYKVQFRLGRLVKEIVDRGANKYAYVQRARNLLWALLCQAILNEPRLEERAEQFGPGLSLEANTRIGCRDWRLRGVVPRLRSCCRQGLRAKGSRRQLQFHADECGLQTLDGNSVQSLEMGTEATDQVIGSAAPNQSLNLTGAAFWFRAACSRCSGPGKLALSFKPRPPVATGPWSGVPPGTSSAVG